MRKPMCWWGFYKIESGKVAARLSARLMEWWASWNSAFSAPSQCSNCVSAEPYKTPHHMPRPKAELFNFNAEIIARFAFSRLFCFCFFFLFTLFTCDNQARKAFWAFASPSSPFRRVICIFIRLQDILVCRPKIGNSHENVRPSGYWKWISLVVLLRVEWKKRVSPWGLLCENFSI